MSINNSPHNQFAELTVQGVGEAFQVKASNGADLLVCDIDDQKTTINGDLNVLGTITYTNSQTLSIQDP